MNSNLTFISQHKITVMKLDVSIDNMELAWPKSTLQKWLHANILCCFTFFFYAHHHKAQSSRSEHLQPEIDLHACFRFAGTDIKARL